MVYSKLFDVLFTGGRQLHPQLLQPVLSGGNLRRHRNYANDLEAIPEFRKTHITAIVISVIQLAAVVWSITVFRL